MNVQRIGAVSQCVRLVADALRCCEFISFTNFSRLSVTYTFCLLLSRRLKTCIGQIPLHELPRDVHDFPETSPRQVGDVSGKSRTCRRLVRDFPETSTTSPRLPRDVRDFPETSPRRLGEVSDKSETSPRQVGGTPWISPTPPPCDVGVLQDG